MRRLIIIFMVIAFTLPTMARSNDDINPNTNTAKKNSVLAAYLAGFVKFVEFQDEKDEVEFCIIGNTDLAGMLHQAATLSLNDRTLKIFTNEEIKKPEECNMVFIDKNYFNSGKQFLSMTEVLLISDMDDFLERYGGTIQIKEQNGRLTFALDVKKAELAPYKISSKLVELAEKVY